MPTNTRFSDTIQIHQDAANSIRSSFKNIATFSGNGCFIKYIGNNTLEISSYSDMAIKRAIAELRIVEGTCIRQHLHTHHYRPNRTIIIHNLTTINNDLFTRIRSFVNDGCFLFLSTYNNINSVYIKANTQSSVDLVYYIIQQTDNGLPIVVEPTNMNDTMVELFDNYTDTIDLIGKITDTHITIHPTTPTTYSLQATDFHSIEYAYLLLNNFEHSMDSMKKTNDCTYVTSYHVSMENLLGPS